MTGVKYEDLTLLRNEMREIADYHKCTMAQVALNWAICKEAIPLVGIKKKSSLEDCLGALKFTLTKSQIESLDKHALAQSTLEKSKIRRMVFLILISMLIFAYYITRWINPTRKKKRN